MSKQDGYASRTAADLERKYNFGKTFAEVYGLVADARKIAEEAQNAYADLSQEQIFNLLTNYGEAQGIYRDDTGNVYVNASYIKSGTISGDNVKVAAAVIEGKLTAAQIDATDLSVNAANITGTLKAGQIDTTNLTVSAANITGTLSASIISGGYLNFDNVIARNLQVDAADITGTITAGELQGSSISLMPSRSYVAGYIDISGASTASFAIDLISRGALRLEARYGAAYMESGYGTYLQLDGSVNLGGGNTRPGSDRSFSCGTSGRMWTDVYAVNQTIESSDLNAKKDINYGLDEYDKFFEGLQPVSFRFKDGTSGRRHIGLISQDVEQALADNGLTTLDFAGFIKSPKEDENGNVVEGEYIYGLRYGEFISMCIAQIQKLNKRVKALEALNT